MFLIVTPACVTLARGQDEIVEAYDKTAYRLETGVFNTYLVNASHRFNLSRPDSLGDALLRQSPQSERLLNRYKLMSSIGTGLLLIGTLVGASGTNACAEEPREPSMAWDSACGRMARFGGADTDHDQK